MLFEILLYIVGYYIFTGISIYAYAVIKAHEILGVWQFGIKDGYIAGICPYPKWLLFWLEFLVRMVSKRWIR